MRSGVNCTRLKSQIERRGHGLDQQRLGHARHALEQHVAAHEQRGDQAGQRALLTDHDLARPRRARRGSALVGRDAAGSRRGVRINGHAGSPVVGHQRSGRGRAARRRRAPGRRPAPPARVSGSMPVRAATTSTMSSGGIPAGRSEAFGHAATHIGAQQVGRALRTLRLLQQLAHREHELGPGDVDGLWLERPAGPAGERGTRRRRRSRRTSWTIAEAHADPDDVGE